MKLSRDRHQDKIKIVVNDKSKVDNLSEINPIKEDKNSENSQEIKDSENNESEKEKVIEESTEESNEEKTTSDEYIDIDKMKSEIEEKNKRIDELEERLQKLYADYDNFRKRKEAEADSAKKYAAEKIVSELLPIVDNFERAVDASEKTKNYDSLKEGVIMINRQIWEILGKVGLSAIESIGNVFDPALHQAVFCEKKEDVDEDVVIAELLKGYKLHDKVIRPSMVIVNKK